MPRGRAADLTVVLLCAAIVGAGTLIALTDRDGPDRAPMALGWALAATACGSLYLRRRYPVTVGVVTLLAGGLYYVLMSADGPVVLAFGIALYTAAAQGRLPAAVGLTSAALLATAYGEIQADDRHLTDSSLFLLTGWLIAAIALGSVARSHRAYLREVEQRALDAERGRETAARQRAVDERLRIARELHDVLGHNISMINVQAAAALHRMERDRAHSLTQAESALTSIKQASKEALRELRATLGLLRQVDQADGGSPDPAAAISPIPGVARLGELTDHAATTGLTVRSETEGQPRPMPAEVDLAVYRIVQEALTNVTRHARASTAVVRLRYGDDEVTVQIDDDGERHPAEPEEAASEAGIVAPTPGNGMLGMSERVMALGGRFTAGHRPGGGFTVRAALPLDDTPSDDAPSDGTPADGTPADDARPGGASSGGAG